MIDGRSYQNAEPNYKIKEQLDYTHCVVALPTLQPQELMADDIAAPQCVRPGCEGHISAFFHSFFFFFAKFKSLKCKKFSSLAPFTLENISNTFHIQIWQHGVQSIIEAITNPLELLAYSLAIFPYNMAIHISRYFRDGYCTFFFSSFCGFI